MNPLYFDKRRPNLNVESIVIVEGPDDAYFLDALFRKLMLDPKIISIQMAGGKDKIGTTLGPIEVSPL